MIGADTDTWMGENNELLAKFGSSGFRLLGSWPTSGLLENSTHLLSHRYAFWSPKQLKSSQHTQMLMSHAEASSRVSLTSLAAYFGPR